MPSVTTSAAASRRARDGVDAADVRQVEVRRVDRLAAQLGVEVEAAGGEALVLDQLHQGGHQLLRVVGELVGVPAVARIAAIDVDGAEDAVGARRGDLVLEVQSRERRVIDLDVDLDLLRQPIALQEGEHGGDVVIVLVLGGLERLGLDEDRALEADAVLVLHDHGEEPAVLIELPRRSVLNSES